MTELERLQAQRDALANTMASGVSRVAGHGKTAEFRSLGEMERTLASLDARIAALRSTKPVRRIYIPGSKNL